MIITGKIFNNYIDCNLKAHLVLQGETGVLSDYEVLKSEFRDKLIAPSQAALLSCFKPSFTSRRKLPTFADLKNGYPLLLAGILKNGEYAFSYNGLQRVDGASGLGTFHYRPIIFHEGETVREQQKLLLTFGAFVLGQIQGHTPAIGVVVYSQYCKITTFRLARFESKVNDLLDGLRELTIDNVEPQLTLNRYCELCQFRDRCTNEATAKDDLSLLRSMSETEKKKNNRKGIFTVKQLSYTFRPRKRNKGGDVQRSPYYYSLQALAIRENKTYILNKPTIPTPRIQAYVDMEGNSNARSIYLIGLVVVEDVEASTYSFWADDAKDEEKIFLQLFDTLAKLKDVHLFHYGSYETRALKRMLPLASKKGIADLVTKRSHNVLSSIYSYVYFPTYSNSLKEIGQYLGYVWTTPGSSGIQSVVWRKRWEITHDSTRKTTLIQYNLDDCLALRIVTDCVRAIANGKPPSGSDSALCDVALADEVQNASDYRQWGRQTFATDAFKIIADCAYFDYQRDKVYFRTNTKLKRARREAQKKHRARQKPNKVVEYIGKKCTYCKGNDISRHPEQYHSKVTLDLRVSASGIRRWITERRAVFHQCNKCWKFFQPASYKKQRRIGHNILAWGIHQHISNRITLKNLSLTARECFGLDMIESHFQDIKESGAKYYRTTYDQILKGIINGPLIHTDETGAPLQHHIKGYVWAFANMDSVAYLYRPTRKGDFLGELLKDFEGVLVSDFYTAYDSLNCLQQKCLVHLMRDLNVDLLKHPFDEELKEIGVGFGELMRPVIETIDRFGLKRRHLSKHLKDARKFVHSLGKRRLKSDISQQYGRRFTKYEEKLFEFMNHDGIPWNNNNAENAIKPFAKYRRLVKGRITEPGVKDYLVLLSMYQTCKYRNISFFDFLLSKEQDIDKYCGG